MKYVKWGYLQEAAMTHMRNITRYRKKKTM